MERSGGTSGGTVPDTNRSCRDFSNCAPRPRKRLELCPCATGDLAVLSGGVLNALVGWLVSFAAMYEVLYSGACSGGRQRIPSILSPHLVFFGGLGALAASKALECKIVSDDEVHQISFASSQVVVGLVALSLWFASLFGLGAPMQGTHSWKMFGMWSLSSLGLLVFCGLVLRMAWELYVMVEVRATDGAHKSILFQDK